MKQKFRLLFFLIGVVGMVVLFIQLDPANIPWHDLFSTKTLYLFAGLFALWFVIYTLHTLSYYVILGKEGKKIRFFSLFRIVMTGFALNSVTPAGLVGGEPYRIMELGRYCSAESSSAATLTFSLFYVMGHLLLWATAAVLYILFGMPGNPFISGVIIVSGLACLAAAVLFFRSKKHGFVLPAVRFFSRWPLLKKPLSKLLSKNEESLGHIDANIIAFRKQRNKFWPVTLLQYSSRLLEAAEYTIILLYFGADVTFAKGLLIFGVASLIANLVFIIPMQAGTREGGLYIATGFFSIADSIASITSLVYRVRELTCIFVGIMVVLIRQKDKADEDAGTPPEETKES